MNDAFFFINSLVVCVVNIENPIHTFDCIAVFTGKKHNCDWPLNFCNVAKMATVEWEKCDSMSALLQYTGSRGKQTGTKTTN